MKRPAFQFYPGDYLRDLALRTCSVGARGVWWDMVCLMHDGTPYGHLRVNAKDILPPTLARIVGVPLPELEGYLAELEESGVFARTAAGTIYSRRMVRDEEIRQARAAGGVKSLQHPNVQKPKRVKDTLEGYPSTPSSAASLPPSPAVASASPSAEPLTPLPPADGAVAPGVALTLHRNGNGHANGNGHGKSKALTKRPSQPVAEVRNRIATLMADLVGETRSELRAEERREVMVDLVFAYWAAKTGRGEAKLDPKRYGKIRERLLQADENIHQLLYAVDGLLKDDNLMGRKDGRKYDEVRTVFRDYEQVERLAGLGGYREGKVHPMAMRHLAPILEPQAELQGVN